MTVAATVEFKYRGREISQEDILYIRALIKRHPKESRRTLSTKLCEAWQWRQDNGALRDMVCRGMLLMLDRAGQIALPPVSDVRHNPLANRVRPEPARMDPERFRGTCYRAANWVLLGKTTGRGKQSNSYVPNRSIKEVLGYPLTKRFRERLGGVA